MAKYTVGDASSVLWENLKTLKAWTPEFVKQRKAGKLSPMQTEAFSNLLNHTASLRFEIVSTLDTLENRSKTEKITGKQWPVFIAEMEAAFDDIGKALAEFGIVPVIVAAAIAIAAALATASVSYAITMGKQAETKIKTAELANQTALAVIDCKKTGKCSEKDVAAIMQPFKEALKSEPVSSPLKDIKDIMLYLGVVVVVVGGVIVLYGPVKKFIISRRTT